MNITLRAWQARFAEDLRQHTGQDYLLVAAPAAGKTFAAGAAVASAMEARDADQLIVIAPTVVVRDQWQQELQGLGYRMSTSLSASGWPAHMHGVCMTYAQVAFRSDQIAQACQLRGTVAILDEIHHAGESRVWGDALVTALADARLRLALSGTPFRSDQAAIPFVQYDDGLCVADFQYDYRQAVAEGVCRPIEFTAHDGLITWDHEDGRSQATFSQEIPAPSRPKRLRASLDPSQPYLRELLAAAHRDLLAQREQIPDAGGLIVCDSQAHALAIDRVLSSISGELPTIAMSDVPHAHAAIRSFATSDDLWLISVRMVSEGVDVPRLGVIGWLTGAKTELMVRQIAGRAMRSRADTPRLPARMHMPADPGLIQFAKRLDMLGHITATSRQERDERSSGPPRATRPTGRTGLRAVAALPYATPEAIAPPTASAPTSAGSATVEATIATPALPPSQQEIADAHHHLQTQRGEVLRLLGVHVQLQRPSRPGFQLAGALREMTAAVGPVTSDASIDQVTAALNWLNAQIAAIAVQDPQSIVQMARAKRRRAIAAAA